MRSEQTSRIRLGNRIGRSLIALLVFAATVYAKPGDLDPSFGNGGKVTTNVSSTGDSSDFANAAAGLFGLIVAAGSSNAAGPTGEDFALARYAPNGALDPTFGIGGKVTTDFGLTSDRAFAVAIDGSGRAVAAGVSHDNFALARYRLNGSLDVTFSGGTVTTDFGVDSDGFHINSFATAVAIQANGRIVAAGAVRGDFALVRYETNGALDSTFGSSGTVTTHIGTALQSSQIHAIVIQPNGKIVAAGVVSTLLGSNDTALARYNTDGTLDSTFGSGGIVTIDVTGTNDADLANAVALQSNGQIVAAGGTATTTATGNTTSFALVRLNADGTLDGSFGTGGIVTTNFGLHSFSEATSLAVQTNGKLVAGGYADVTGQDFALIRYQSNGALDPSFGVGGKTTTDFTTSSNTDDSILGLVIQPNGKIVGVGYADNDFAVARYDK